MYKSIRSANSKSALTVVGIYSGSKSLPTHLKEADKSAAGEISAAFKRPGFRAELGEVSPVGNKHILIGLGEKDALTLQSLRKLGGKLVRSLNRFEVTAIRLDLGSSIAKTVGTTEEIHQAIAEGVVLGNWRVTFFDGTATRNENATQSLSLSADGKPATTGLKRGITMAEATNYARRLASMPPNICNPTFMAKEARKLANKTSLSCKVINFAEAKKLGMGGLCNVGMASIHKPCLIQLTHSPKGKKTSDETIVIVGKTITYDTGGYSLKISGGMKGMKYDKNGGMAVIGAMQAIAALDLPVKVVALLPAAENMVGGDAYRPDDIITMYNGVSVEVTNTDAEGRLVMADALAYACKKLKPTKLIDIATLTGGVVVALGSWSAGMWCNDEQFVKQLKGASAQTDEKLWHMPLWEEHRDFMRSKHADIWNSGPKRDGHPIQGAAFLSFFVDEDVPWAHLDIAGMSSVDSDGDVYVNGPTGFGVRLLTELVANSSLTND